MQPIEHNRRKVFGAIRLPGRINVTRNGFAHPQLEFFNVARRILQCGLARGLSDDGTGVLEENLGRETVQSMINRQNLRTGGRVHQGHRRKRRAEIYAENLSQGGRL
jgi:hypothetical protein